ncbi:MAG: T9SS type A sorting domain-containing protein [Bacteroidetes bacterium]|nr:T9SS type A sorting domain-containing protein [Bacteroidota bacterium]
MKNLYFLFLVFAITQKAAGQQNYCDFEGNKVLSFGLSAGVLDSFALNPNPNGVNGSSRCARYVRDTVVYDIIRLYPNMKLVDVTAYADSSAQSPKIKMKLYTSAPVGTEIQLQLGMKSIDSYPAGTHSSYAGKTTVQNAWEQITFYYYESPVGSTVLPTNIDKIILLFDPLSTSRDTMYFDDLAGPPLINPAGISMIDASPSFKLSQNSPNPAKQNTVISFQLNTSGLVSLELFDMLGNLVSSVLNQEMKAGAHSIPLETGAIPNGIYFYVLKKDEFSQTKRMVVSKNY